MLKCVSVCCGDRVCVSVLWAIYSLRGFPPQNLKKSVRDAHVVCAYHVSTFDLVLRVPCDLVRSSTHRGLMMS